MKVSYLKIVKWLVALFILAFLLMQLYHGLYNPFRTEMVGYQETYESIRATAWFVRNEQVLLSDTAGVRNYLVRDGERVAKNGTVAQLYAEEAQVQRFRQIEALDQEIAALRELASYSASSADLSLLNSQIRSEWVSLLSSAENAAFTRIGDRAETLLSLLNRRSIAVGETTDFSGQIQSLQAQRDGLAAAGGTPIGAITTNESGYFVSAVDGYESVFSPDRLDELTPSALLSPTAQAVPAQAVGKMVGDYQWYLAINIPFQDSLLLREGEPYTIHTGLSTMDTLPVTLAQINSDDNDEYVTAIFSCSYTNGELSSIRSQTVDVILQEYAGLRLNTKAIRVVNGVRGVNVNSASAARFKQIEILYNAGDYVICSYDSSDTSKLNLYDEVIVKGRNLYDGKSLAP